jgi:hypothetical protein
MHVLLTEIGEVLVPNTREGQSNCPVNRGRETYLSRFSFFALILARHLSIWVSWLSTAGGITPLIPRRFRTSSDNVVSTSSQHQLSICRVPRGRPYPRREPCPGRRPWWRESRVWWDRKLLRRLPIFVGRAAALGWWWSRWWHMQPTMPTFGR